ncbi:hypothetical protein [Portibacter marinus]|uniref:hypothetical protein n=1 Tax=Portibacter marinus TaxID=2898660 RepID=UPI001F2EF636|nr:hypothetical protein [Portibacter marinus]
MKKDILHILNGDATFRKFRDAGFTGQYMVWRETLALGPLFYQIDSELFWDMRSQFMEAAYGAKLAEYRRSVMLEFGKLRKFQGPEIVLWYEYDVFCQVNFIALMSYILKYKKEVKVSIICVGDHPQYKHRVGLGEINTQEYQVLYNNRKILMKYDLLVADKAWMMFCAMAVEQFSSIQSDRLPYLSDALEASKVLFGNGESLSKLESEIMSMLQSSPLKKQDVIRKLLAKDHALGFGDLQYDYLIRKVSGQYLI